MHHATAAEAEALMTHRDDVDPGWLEAVRNAAAHVLAPTNPTALAVERLVDCACRINANAHAMTAGGSPPTAFGLFPMVAMLNHSCAPNACYTAVSDQSVTMELRTTRAVTAGEELSLQYIALYQPRRRRLEQLAAERHFTCLCARCESGDAEDLLLGTAEGSAAAEALSTLEHALEQGRHDAAQPGAESTDRLEAACACATPHLHECHYQLYRAHRVLADAAAAAIAAAPTPAAPAARAARTKAVAHCEAVVACVTSAVCPPHSMEAASWLLRLAELYVAAAFHGEGSGEARASSSASVSSSASASVSASAAAPASSSTSASASASASATASAAASAAASARAVWIVKAHEAFSAAHAHQCVCLGAQHDAAARTAQWIQRMDVARSKR